MPRPSLSYNTSIGQEKFTDYLKYSVVIQIFKNGEKSLIANYRPISLLTGFSEIYEILIYRRFIQHIQLQNIIVSQKFGFRKGLSMENATYQLIETVSYAWNSKKNMAEVFCDLTKAFFD
jgi:hypothetical protein